MPADSESSPQKSRIDVRTLSLAQLKAAADRGSRRARAELDARLAEAPTTLTDTLTAYRAPPPTARPRPAEPRRAESPAPSRAPVAAAPAQRDSLSATGMAAPAPHPTGATRPAPTMPRSTRPADLPAAAQAASALVPPAARVPGAAMPGVAAQPDAPAGPPAASAALVEQLEFIARHSEGRELDNAGPRLVGMMLVLFGVLMLLGGAVMLAKTGNAFFMVAGVLCGVTGYLLARGRLLAVWVYLAGLLVLLGWTWWSAKGNVATLAVQGLPPLLLGIYLLLPQVRDRLD